PPGGYELAGPTRVSGDDGKTGSAGLEQHLSEGVGRAREAEDVRARVELGERRAGELADEARAGRRGELELAARWAVACYDETHVAPLAAEEREGVEKNTDPLFRREPAHRQEQDLSLRPEEVASQVLVPPLGPEQVRVDASSPDADRGVAARAERSRN